VLRLYRRPIELGLEGAERVGHGVCNRNGGRNRAAFADAFDAKRIERRAKA
jgi:hypothetical protein